MHQSAATKKASPLWFGGVCDDLLFKVMIWGRAYWRGEVHSTRQFLELDGRVVDKPTKMAHDIPFREVELDHLVRIGQALKPDSPLLEELIRIKGMWKNGKAVRGNKYFRNYWAKVNLPTGIHKVITLAFYPEHVNEIVNMLKQAKTGQRSTTLEKIVQERQEQGKDLFEE